MEPIEVLTSSVDVCSFIFVWPLTLTPFLFALSRSDPFPRALSAARGPYRAATAKGTG